jgi:hypothetical protein
MISIVSLLDPSDVVRAMTRPVRPSFDAVNDVWRDVAASRSLLFGRGGPRNIVPVH